MTSGEIRLKQQEGTLDETKRTLAARTKQLEESASNELADMRESVRHQVRTHPLPPSFPSLFVANTPHTRTYIHQGSHHIYR